MRYVCKVRPQPNMQTERSNFCRISFFDGFQIRAYVSKFEVCVNPDFSLLFVSAAVSDARQAVVDEVSTDVPAKRGSGTRGRKRSSGSRSSMDITPDVAEKMRKRNIQAKIVSHLMPNCDQARGITAGISA